MKRYISICLIAMSTAMIFTGCQSSNEETTNTSSVSDDQAEASVSVEGLISKTTATAEKITTFASDFYLNIVMDEGETDLQIISKVEINDTDKLIGHIQTETTENDTVYNQNVYLEQLNETVSILTENETEWTEIKYSKDEALDVVGAYYGISNYIYFLKNGENFEKVQSSDPSDKNTTTLKCTISADKLYDMIQNTHLFYFMGMNQIGEECYAEAPDISVELQFDKEHTPISLSVELGEVLEVVSNYIVNQLGGSLKEANVQNYKIYQTFYNINDELEIDIPISARDAVNYGNEVYMISGLNVLP